MAVSSSAALDFVVPKRQDYARPNKHAIEQPHLVPVKKQATRQVEDPGQSLMRTVRIVLICALFFALTSILIFERAQLVYANNEMASLEQQMSAVKAETVRLESEFNSRVSVGNVETYARNELGMVKRQNHQMTVFRNDGTDEIVIPGITNNP